MDLLVHFCERIFDLELVHFLLQGLQERLKQHCGPGYQLVFQAIQDPYLFGDFFQLSLMNHGQELSHIKLELFPTEIYMHSETKKEHEGNKYNTFLRAVIILIAYLLRFDHGKKYKQVKSIPLNWISFWLLYSKFGFRVNSDYEEDERYEASLKYLDLFFNDSTKQILMKFFKERLPIPGLYLDLEDLDFRLYCELCQQLLREIHCRGK
jgi:hypothetical protein